MTQRNTQPFVLFFSTPGGMSVQSTLINKWNIIKLKFLHSKANNQQNDKKSTKWEKIFANNAIEKWLIINLKYTNSLQHNIF